MADADNLLDQFLEKVAKEQKYDDYKTSVAQLNTGGANFTSLLYNITISAPNKDDLKLFTKVSAMTEQVASISTKQFFDTEIIFYSKLVAKYREYEERYYFPEEDRLILPKYYDGSVDSAKDIIILEDLAAVGYTCFDRFKCYDWEFARECISFLAKLHAHSIRYQREDPIISEKLAKTDVIIPMLSMKDFMDRLTRGVIQATAEENRERLAKFLEANRSVENMMKFYTAARKVVFSHGDLKPNNVLLRRNQDDKLELVIIDYQFVHKGNPVTDLVYFLISGSDVEFRKEHLDQYFEHYYAEFSKTLRRLEIDPDEVYSKEEFDSDVKTILPYGLLNAVTTLPLIAMDEEDAPNLEEDLDIENFDIKLSKNFKKRFNGLVNDYIRLGFL